MHQCWFGFHKLIFFFPYQASLSAQIVVYKHINCNIICELFGFCKIVKIFCSEVGIEKGHYKEQNRAVFAGNREWSLKWCLHFSWIWKSHVETAFKSVKQFVWIKCYPSNVRWSHIANLKWCLGHRLVINGQHHWYYIFMTWSLAQQAGCSVHQVATTLQCHGWYAHPLKLWTDFFHCNFLWWFCFSK